MAPSKKCYGAPFSPVVNKPGQIHHGTVVAINPEIHPNTSIRRLNCVQTSTSVILRLKKCTIIAIDLPHKNILEALQEILPSVTSTSIFFGDVNFDGLSDSLSAEQIQVLDILQEYGFEHIENGTDFRFTELTQPMQDN